MKNLLLTLITLSLVSCWSQPQIIEITRPVKTTTVEPLNLYNKEFIGSLEAVESTVLSFIHEGYITSIALSSGSKVLKGEIIAEIDPADYILKVEAEKAAYLTDKAAKERSDRLLERGAVSLQENEIATSRLKASKARYLYAQSELENTKLRAPFSGSIETFYIEQYQSVKAGEGVCKLINADELEVSFTLPESDITLSTINPQFEIEIEGHPHKRFSATIKEIVDASVDGAGIPVTLRISDTNFTPTKLAIKPGFACRVTVKVDEELTKNNYFTIPLTAIFSTPLNDTSKFVWTYNPKTQRVIKQEIKTEGLFGSNSIIVSQGLDSTQLVVSAGVYQISNNQKVKNLNP